MCFTSATIGLINVYVKHNRLDCCFTSPEIKGLIVVYVKHNRLDCCSCKTQSGKKLFYRNINRLDQCFTKTISGERTLPCVPCCLGLLYLLSFVLLCFALLYFAFLPVGLHQSGLPILATRVGRARATTTFDLDGRP